MMDLIYVVLLWMIRSWGFWTGMVLGTVVAVLTTMPIWAGVIAALGIGIIGFLTLETFRS